MPTELRIGLPTLFGFLLVLARVSGLILLVPLPGFKDAPEAARIVLALALTVALLPVWPAPDVDVNAVGRNLTWVAAEFAFGLVTGVAISFLLEGVQMASQIVGLQAGYSYASTVDPSTQADSTVLQMMIQMFTGILFFALGLDGEVIHALAHSIERYPTGLLFRSSDVTGSLIRLGSGIFSTGLRLALPVLTLLLLLDLSLAILGKAQAQLQLISLSFSVKMLAALAMLTTILGVYPLVLRASAAHSFEALFRVMGR